MKIGFSACNFPYRSFEDNLRFAHDHGFDFIEAFGPEIDRQLQKDGGKNFARLLREYHLDMTLHHALPDPEKPEKVAAFRTAMEAIHEFALREKVMNILSFDTWVDREKSLSSLLFVLELFKDIDIPILTEDFPLNDKDAELWRDAFQYPRYGLLSDIGHTNVRLCDTGDQAIWCLWNEGENLPLPAGDNSPEAFRNALKRKPLPIYQLHIHNNNGKADEHWGISHGTANYAAIIPILKESGFDGYVDLEISPTIHGITGEEADALLLEALRLFREYWS